MTISRRAAIKSVVAMAIGTGAGTGAYGVIYERHRIETTEVSLGVLGLPDALDGLRIAFITDVHHSRMVPAADVTRAVEIASAGTPDLVVLGGDYVTRGDRAYMGPVAELLSPLHAPHGVFAILGNHDDDREMPARLTRHGVQVLRDARTRLEIRGAALELAGVRFWTRRLQDVARVLRGSRDTVLLLAHDPRRLTEAAALGVPAVLSGHTHGGQVVLPGASVLVGRRFPILAGLTARANTSLFVSRGIGTVYMPVRINCPPEVAFLTLRTRTHAER